MHDVEHLLFTPYTEEGKKPSLTRCDKHPDRGIENLTVAGATENVLHAKQMKQKPKQHMTYQDGREPITESMLNSFTDRDVLVL